MKRYQYKGWGDEKLSKMAILLGYYLGFYLLWGGNSQRIFTAADFLALKSTLKKDEVSAALEELQTAGYIKEAK